MKWFKSGAFIAIGLALFLPTTIYWLVPKYFIVSKHIAVLGTLGDFIGGTTSGLLNLAGLLLVLASIKSQERLTKEETDHRELLQVREECHLFWTMFLDSIKEKEKENPDRVIFDEWHNCIYWIACNNIRFQLKVGPIVHSYSKLEKNLWQDSFRYLNELFTAIRESKVTDEHKKSLERRYLTYLKYDQQLTLYIFYCAGLVKYKEFIERNLELFAVSYEKTMSEVRIRKFKSYEEFNSSYVEYLKSEAEKGATHRLKRKNSDEYQRLLGKDFLEDYQRLCGKTYFTDMHKKREKKLCKDITPTIIDNTLKYVYREYTATSEVGEDRNKDFSYHLKKYLEDLEIENNDMESFEEMEEFLKRVCGDKKEDVRTFEVLYIEVLPSEELYID